MSENTRDTEELRKELLADVYAGAMSGLGAMILDENRIQNADADELEKIAKEYGYQDESKQSDTTSGMLFMKSRWDTEE